MWNHLRPALCAALILIAPAYRGCKDDTRSGGGSPQNVNQTAALKAAEERQIERPACSDLLHSGAVFGVTITEPDKVDDRAIRELRKLTSASAKPVVTRVVFDPIKKTKEADFERALNDYRDQVEKIRQVSCVMGEIGDSKYMHFYLPDPGEVKRDWPVGYRNYEQWTERLARKMGPLVDLWEFGNEINGDWTGWKDEDYQGKTTAELVAKQKAVLQAIAASYNKLISLRADHVIKDDALTAITLYYNDDGKRPCDEYPEARMRNWATWAKGLQPDIFGAARRDVDLVLLSYYASDCGSVDGSVNGLEGAFGFLSRVFDGPHTSFGLGEVGYASRDCPTDLDDEKRVNKRACQVGQVDYVKSYYTSLDPCLREALGRNKPEPDGHGPVRYVGGYFYWWYLQDFIQSKKWQSPTPESPVMTAVRTFGADKCEAGRSPGD
jgi:hypothetical protein